MIGAFQSFCSSTALNNLGGMMPAHVEKRFYVVLFVSHHDKRLSQQVASEKLTNFCNFINSTHRLPRFGKN